MEIRHLRYFVTVAEELHFARAAERIGIEQSPLSRAIRELEADLGVQLFSRTRRSTRLTRAGESFLADARRILTEIRQARSSARAAAAGREATLRIGLTQSIAQSRLTRVLALTRQEEPELDLSLLDLAATQQVRELQSGSIQLALSPIEVDPDEFCCAPLWSGPLAAILATSHPLAAAASLTLSQLQRDATVACHPEVQQACSALDPELAMTGIANLPLLLDMVSAGLTVGIALVDQVEPMHRADVVTIPFTDPRLTLTTFAIRCHGAPSAPCSRWLERARRPLS